MRLYIDKDETEEQRELSIRERENNYLSNNGYLTYDEIENLTLTKQSEILNYTIEKIKNYYFDIELNELNLSVCELKNKGKESDIRFAKNKTRNLLKNNILTVLYLIRVKKEYGKLYYYELYNFFVGYGNFVKKYKLNMDIVKDLQAINKKDSSLFEHFSKPLQDMINFHNQIRENQLNHYYFFYELKKKEHIKMYCTIYNLIFGSGLRPEHINIDSLIENPYFT
jgi:hypothetical protein